jgi:hypothetical protein
MAEWISIGIASLALVGSVVAALVKNATAIAGITAATRQLSGYLEKQDTRLDSHGRRLDNHESRIVAVETVHKVRGCAEAET